MHYRVQLFETFKKKSKNFEKNLSYVDVGKDHVLRKTLLKFQTRIKLIFFSCKASIKHF